VVSSLAALGLTACAPGGGADEPINPLTHPEFLTPVGGAIRSGLTPYWLGERFPAGGLEFRLLAGVELISTGDPPGLELPYAGELVEGTVPFHIESHTASGGGAEVFRSRAATWPEARMEHVQVGELSGELYTIPSAERPANQLWLFLNLGETTVIAQVDSGATGVPGTDPNPLIDKDLLISVLAEHLRPYPE
jgi:hypothetical protein